MMGLWAHGDCAAASCMFAVFVVVTALISPLLPSARRLVYKALGCTYTSAPACTSRQLFQLHPVSYNLQ
jgi:hypothetical protein